MSRRLEASGVRIGKMDPEGRRLVGLVDSRDCGACTAAQEAGVIVLRSIADGEGNLEWFVMSPGPEALKEKVTSSRRRRSEFEIVRGRGRMAQAWVGQTIGRRISGTLAVCQFLVH